MEMNQILKSEVFKNKIKGLFMWRGTEKPFEITDHPSYEYHKF
jgi:hypothetical protein